MPLKLSDIALDQIYAQQHLALMRLQVFYTGRVHQGLLDLGQALRAALLAAADSQGQINALAGLGLRQQTADLWGAWIISWEIQFQTARRQAALLPFAGLAREYEHFMGLAEVAEGGRGAGAQGGRGAFSEADPPVLGVVAQAFYEQQLQDILDATAERVYGDGFKLSQRVWNLDTTSLQQIQVIINDTLASGDSAWNAAKRLEEFLGAGEDCPRWTSTRLGLDKAGIAAGDGRGLISGDECSSQGVSYKALRLARNEIQIVHAAATDAIFQRSPWVTAEKINLSPSHPTIGCRCEDIVVGGENGDGVYPVGEIGLPIHVQCLCFKTAELMDPDAFTNRLKGWLNGSQSWTGMDNFATWLNVPRQSITTAIVGELYDTLAQPMLTWLDGSQTDMEAALE